MNSDLYEVLGVATEATAKDIASAYKALARKFHPDVNPDDPAAEERFKGITAAYDVLGDEKKRAEYDQFSSMVGTGFDGAGFDGTGLDGTGFDGGGPSVEDLLGQMFGGQRPFGGGGFGGSGFARLMTNVTLDFEEAVRGATISVQTPDGPQSLRVPAGVEDGAQMLMRLPDAEIVVVFSVRAHPTFERDGKHLRIQHSVPFTTLCLGGTMKVATLDGTTVTLKVPEGTSVGRTFRVPGRGIVIDGAITGDLLVSVTTEIPTELTDAQRTALESFVAVSESTTTTSD